MNTSFGSYGNVQHHMRRYAGPGVTETLRENRGRVIVYDDPATGQTKAVAESDYMTPQGRIALDQLRLMQAEGMPLNIRVEETPSAPQEAAVPPGYEDAAAPAGVAPPPMQVAQDAGGPDAATIIGGVASLLIVGGVVAGVVYFAKNKRRRRRR